MTVLNHSFHFRYKYLLLRIDDTTRLVIFIKVNISIATRSLDLMTNSLVAFV